MTNLIRDSTLKATGLKLKTELFQWLKETNGLQIPLKKPIDQKNDNRYMNTY